MTPNLTLSGAINPDFSQVEADARQLDINEPFALFYDEKRPFFMEGADFFNTPLNAVHTRMIRDPAWGLKLTGKEGAHTVGAYSVQDDVTNLIIPGSQGSSATSLEADNLSTVLRYQHDIGNRHTLGALITDREGDDYFNRVAGLDGDFRISEQDRITLQILGSSTSYPGEVGTAYTWNATATSWYSKIDLELELNHSEDSRGDATYDLTPAIRSVFVKLGYAWVP